MRGFVLRLGVAGATVVVSGLLLAATVALLAPQVRAFFTAVDGGDPPRLDFDPLDVRSVVYAADGSVLDQLHAEQDRVPVPLDIVPPHVVRAVLDAEDERFWEHGALDLRSLSRALVSNIESGGVIEGGSTITQQLVKNAFLSPERDLQRKVQEAFLAVRLAEQMSKEEILERYLNTVYFGNGAYGLQAAAERYFGTDVTKLTLGQGVLLASLIRNPAGADPWTDPAAAIARRDAVIRRMQFLGHITPEQAVELSAEPLPEPPPEEPTQGSDYFVETVKQELLNNPRYGLGATVEARTDKVFRGGLHIVTTLDRRAQSIAEAKVAEILPDSGGQFTAALVSVDVRNGAVVAMVGGPDFSQAKFNLVTQGGRQTGSSFKTLALVAALESGYVPDDRINGSGPCRIPNPGGEDDPWEVKNAGVGYVMTLREATVQSVNCAYARLIRLVGPGKLVEVARRMGITAQLPRQLSLALGAGSVSPLEMAASYATLAADGVHHPPFFITSITDRTGAEIFRAGPQSARAISVEHARAVTDVLKEVPERGTGTAAAVPGWTVAGKTGSTDDNADAWFVGYTPEVATAVWMGSPVGRVPMTNVGGVRVFGGTYPAMIWGSYMRELLADRDPLELPAPTAPDTRTRPPRLLLLADESPPVWFSEPVVAPAPVPAGGGGGDRVRVTVPARERATVPDPTIPEPKAPPRVTTRPPAAEIALDRIRDLVNQGTG